MHAAHFYRPPEQKPLWTLDRDPLDRDPLDREPLDRHPLDNDPPPPVQNNGLQSGHIYTRCSVKFCMCWKVQQWVVYHFFMIMWTENVMPNKSVKQEWVPIGCIPPAFYQMGVWMDLMQPSSHDTRTSTRQFSDMKCKKSKLKSCKPVFLVLHSSFPKIHKVGNNVNIGIRKFTCRAPCVPIESCQFKNQVMHE